MELASELCKRLIELNDLPQSATLPQACSHLDSTQIESEITRRFTCVKVGAAIKRIAGTPWRRIYTLNIDNCLEMAFAEVAAERKFVSSGFERFNHVDSFSELSTAARCSLIHLHGCVDRPQDGYIFSRDEYARSMIQPNSWMVTLCQLIRTEMFVFAGTSLDEIDVGYYLQQRNQRSSRSDIPKSILVEPFPNKLTNKICEDHDFVLFDGTIEALLDALTEIEPRLLDPWGMSEEDGLSDLQLVRADRLKFPATFEPVPRNAAPVVNPARFLLGAELSWDMVAAQADMARDIHPEIREIISDTLEQGEYRLLLLLDQPGSGKTSFLKRMAHDFSRGSIPVFWYSGLGLELEPQDCAAIFDRFKTPILVFVDNFADALTSISLIIDRIVKRDILFVCAERDHRLAHIEGAFSGEEYLQIKDALKLRIDEAERLRRMNEAEGLSTIEKLPARQYLAEVVGKAIAEANCRIQKRFYSIDRITRDLIRECDASQHGAYLAVALARYCFSQGVRRSALAGTTGSDSIEFLLEDQAPLPVKYSDFGRNFVVPKNSLIADRVLEESRRLEDGALLQGFKDLALSLAPRVNPSAIKRKTPEAQLLGRLMDFDSNVKRFINEHAEDYYATLKASCGWNARYWEQLSLMKLDRFFASPDDIFLLEESIQNARSAISREMHPFSLATLAKVLFKAMEQRPDNRDALFQEAWDNIRDADDREKKWPSRGATVFVICFAGVLKFLDMGGQLTGAQYERLREMVQATHRHHFKERNLIEMRGLIEAVL